MNKTAMYYVQPGMYGKGKNVQGKGFFGDMWNGFKSVVNPVGNFIKDHKLISTGLSLLPDPRAKVAGGIAGAMGLGRKRKRKAANKKGKGKGKVAKKGELVLPGAMNAHKLAHGRLLSL